MTARMLGRVIQTFPTTSPSTVELVSTTDDQLVIVKRAPAGELSPQAAQLNVLAALAPPGTYPRLLEAASKHLVLAYVPGVTLREAALPHGELLCLLARAVCTVFGLAALVPPGAQPPAGQRFLFEEIRRRAERTGFPMDARLEEIDARLAPPRLGLAAHGDLTPQNIVYTPATEQLTLIDPRGNVRWVDGWPWWDPVFDLAATVVFHAAIDELDRLRTPEALRRSLWRVRDELLALIHDDSRVRAWTSNDPCWTVRLDYAIHARLLGNAPVQLRYCGRAGAARAALLVETCHLLSAHLGGV